jgi:hypothetical protein
MSTDYEIRIKGRNELGLAVKQAEQQLRGLAKSGELFAKVFRGGAIVGAALARSNDWPRMRKPRPLRSVTTARRKRCTS